MKHESLVLRRVLFYLGLCTPGLIPLLVAYLPFQDWAGHLGVVGVMLHSDEPASKIVEFYEYSGAWKPNSLLYWLITGVAQFLPPLWAGRLIMAFSLAGLGPALAYLCKQTGADERLAYFALPLAIGRHVYCGFIPNAAGLALGIYAIGLYFYLRENSSGPKLLWLFLVLIVTHALHVFVFLATAGLILAAAAWDVWALRRRHHFGVLITTLLSFSSFLPQWISFSERSSSGGGFLSALWTAMAQANRSKLPKIFWDWLFASYRYRTLDDVFQAIWIALLLGTVVLGLRSKQSRSEHSSRLWMMIGLTSTMFVVLPSYIGPPVNWWGGNLRLPVLMVLLLVPLGSYVRKQSSSWLPRLVVGFNLAICALALADLRSFSAKEMAGFEEVITMVPPGKKLTLLHWTPKEVHEYPGEPHGYASNYYLLLKGGYVPQNVFEHPDVPVKRKRSGAAPPWGQAEYFDWQRHAQDYEAFVVRIHPQYEHSPLHGPNQAHVELVGSAGQWRYYRRRSPENLHP